jgi:hypothetical protein
MEKTPSKPETARMLDLLSNQHTKSDLSMNPDRPTHMKPARIDFCSFFSGCSDRRESRVVGGAVHRMRDIIGLFALGDVVNTSEFVLFGDVF